MSNEMTPREAMAEAVRLLRDAADELHESHNAPGETTFDGEPEAQAAYDEHERVANALESAIAARLRGEVCAHSAIAPNMNRCIKCKKVWNGTAWIDPQPAAPAPVAGDAVRAVLDAPHNVGRACDFGREEVVVSVRRIRDALEGK